MTTTDYTNTRIQTIGEVVLAAMVLVGVFQLLVTFRSSDAATFTAIIALTSGAIGTVLGFFFSRQSSAQGASTTNGTTKVLAELITNALNTAAPGQGATTTTVTTPPLDGHPSTVISTSTGPAVDSHLTGGAQ